jgi:RHS repeat-associated protein
VETTLTYAYDPSGLRVSKTVNGTATSYILDGANVALETTGASVSKYIRGVNLICAAAPAATNYYLYNAHGDVTQLANASGTVTKNYDYDAFGNEQNPDTSDTNPFRYCGEYYDLSSGTYYLRARYYDPTIGRFLSEDTHWNTENMIYGDKPLKINEEKGAPLKINEPNDAVSEDKFEETDDSNNHDSLGLNTYTFVPDTAAIKQSGNLYAYCLSNPANGVDPSGHVFIICGDGMSLPPIGPSNDYGILLDSLGNIKQVRFYGSGGVPLFDIDYSHGGVGHDFPHSHLWPRPSPSYPFIWHSLPY